MAKKKQTPSFCSLLNAAIKDETKAPKDYQRLKSRAKCRPVKSVFQSIIDDERKHKRKLVKLQNKFCK